MYIHTYNVYTCVRIYIYIYAHTHIYNCGEWSGTEVCSGKMEEVTPQLNHKRRKNQQVCVSASVCVG